MIVPDVNLLIYAYNSDAPDHRRARRWWEGCLSGAEPVGLCWAVLLAFVRIMTSRSVVVTPLEPAEAISHLRAWLDRPQALVLQPGSRHLEILEHLMTSSAACGPLTTDAHLAALAIEHGAELHSNDSDFGRFPGLRWVDPLRDKEG